MRCIVLILLIALIIASGMYYASNGRKANPMEKELVKYGSKQIFDIEHVDQNDVFQFPDFSVRFIGETSQKLEVNPNLTITYYNFEITDLQGRKRQVSWSSGLGEIAPEFFVVGDQVYQIEVGSSEMHTEGSSYWLYEFAVSKTKKINLAEYVFWTVSQNFFDQLTLEDFEEQFGLKWIKSEQSNESYDMYQSLASSPFESAEIRVNKKDPKKKLLVLIMDAGSHLSDKAVMDKYPNGELSVHSPNDPTHISWTTKESWGKMSFGFGDDGILRDIVLDSVGE